MLFTDKSHFAVNQRKKKLVIRCKGERYSLNNMCKIKRVQAVSHSVKASVAWNHKSPLIFVPRRLTATSYIECVLELYAKPFFKEQRAKGGDIKWF